MDKKKSAHIISKLIKYYGEVSPALDFQNNYQLAIAVVLSAQTTDKQVNKISVELFERFPDFETLAAASIADVEEIIHSTGFFRAKARNIVGLAGRVVEHFHGVLPSTMDELLTLPGVGRKSANVILSHGFGIPALAVDTHVGRVARRIGYTTETDPDRVEESLTAMIPRDQWTVSHMLLITHGRRICKAQKPLCGECPVIKDCLFVYPGSPRKKS